MTDAALPSRAAAAALRDAGVPVLVLRDPGGEAEPSADPAAPTAGSGTMQVLIPPAHVTAAERVLDGLDWRYAWSRGGLLARLAPRLSCWWDGGHELEAYWACPAGPLPPQALGGLTAALWRGAAPDPDGFLRPEPAARIVHLAVQACRPGRGRDADWRELVAEVTRVEDWARVEDLARGAGVGPGVRRAVAAARAGEARPGPGPVYGGWRAPAWWLAAAVQRRARPPRLRRLLAGTPALGDATIRARVGGTEVHAGRGVFVPTPDADLFVALAMERLVSVERPVVIEVGTGCGAIALAIAAARPDSEVHGTELSDSAVGWARRNTRRLGLDRVQLHRGSLLEPLPARLRGRVDVMLANLPFYPTGRYAAIGSVPRDTIEGPGETGLDLVRRLAADAIPFLRPGALLVLQMFAWQWETFASELVALGYRPGAPRTTGPFAICPAELAGGPDPAPTHRRADAPGPDAPGPDGG